MHDFDLQYWKHSLFTKCNLAQQEHFWSTLIRIFCTLGHSVGKVNARTKHVAMGRLNRQFQAILQYANQIFPGSSMPQQHVVNLIVALLHELCIMSHIMYLKWSEIQPRIQKMCRKKNQRKMFLFTFQICLMWMLILCGFEFSKYLRTIRAPWQFSPSFSIPLRTRIGDDDVNMFRWNERMNSLRSCSVFSLLPFEWLPELTLNPMVFLIWLWVMLTFIVSNSKGMNHERHGRIEIST